MAMDIALAADLRVCSDDSKWAMFYIKRGLVADDGGPWLLQRMIGFPKTCELIYFGEKVSAEVDRPVLFDAKGERIKA